MKRFFSVLCRILPHAVLILSVMMLVFFVIDLINPAMAFLNNSITKYLLAVLSVLSGALAICYVLREEKKH
ncbi:MAG: hypothetical protein E7580_08435 [Ruminococcaceae bacterium]|nr:hypothetical protein [Oscillospiraceae bacterium]